jgi:hypothetical protein
MRRYFGVVAVCAVFLLLVSLPASAGSVNNFSNVKLTGNVTGTASGGFTYNSVTNTFSNITLQFNSSLGLVSASLNSMKGILLGNHLVELLWNTKVNGNSIWCSITLNTLTGQYLAAGSISNGGHYGGFNYFSVPEGDATLAYLLLSGMAMLAGIVVAGKQRRLTAVTRR